MNNFILNKTLDTFIKQILKMADKGFEEIVRVHLTMLRAIGPSATAQVSNDWLWNAMAGDEVGAPG